MFDFTFRKFITPTVVGVLYALELLGLTIGIIFWIYMGFQVSSSKGFMYLLGGIIGWFLGVIIIRVLAEAIVAMTRIAENTSEIVDLLKKNQGM